MPSRIELLQAFVNEDPSDPFNAYALALEYLKTNTEKAIELFVRLTLDHPTYLPTYYQLGKLYQQVGQDKKAIAVFDSGIGLAITHKDLKTLQELRSARNEIEDDNDLPEPGT